MIRSALPSRPASAREALDGLLPLFHQVRAQTLALVDGLSEEDCALQSMPDASPAKWHLAHITWFFEVFALERFEPGFRPFHPSFRMLFNSYYNGVGAQHPRHQRGLVTRPDLATVRAWRAAVDGQMACLLERLSHCHLALRDFETAARLMDEALVMQAPWVY
jgi:hypothetical protein